MVQFLTKQTWKRGSEARGMEQIMSADKYKNILAYFRAKWRLLFI